MPKFLKTSEPRNGRQLRKLRNHNISHIRGTVATLNVEMIHPPNLFDILATVLSPLFLCLSLFCFSLVSVLMFTP